MQAVCASLVSFPDLGNFIYVSHKIVQLYCSLERNGVGIAFLKLVTAVEVCVLMFSYFLMFSFNYFVSTQKRMNTATVLSKSSPSLTSNDSQSQNLSFTLLRQCSTEINLCFYERERFLLKTVSNSSH